MDLRCIASRLALSSALSTVVLAPGALRAETFVSSDASTRLVLAFRVPQDALRKWLPSGWGVSPVATGPNQGANLFLGFVDRMLNLDAEGKPIAGGMDRYLGLVVPANRPGADKPVNVVIRLYQSNPGMRPGAYKNSLPAKVSREMSRQGTDTSPADGTDSWEVRDGSGGLAAVRIQYRGGTPVRSKLDLRYYSAVEPEFFRIYRFDQGADVVRSVPSAVDRVDAFQYRVTIPELAELFDGSERLISITVVPWSARQIFLP